MLARSPGSLPCRLGFEPAGAVPAFAALEVAKGDGAFTHIRPGPGERRAP